MLRSAIAFALFLLTGVPTLAQAVTRPIVTASAGYLQNDGFYNAQGDTSQTATKTTSTSLRLGGEAPVYRRGALTASAGARIAVSSFEISSSGGTLRLQNLDLFGRVGTRQGSALLGVSLDLGQSAFEGSDYNTDGQTAFLGQLRGEVSVGPAVLFAQADAAITLATEVEASLDPDLADRLKRDGGDLYGVQAGGAVALGPVSLGIAAFYTTRTDGSFEYADPPQTPGDFPTSGTFESEYGESFGIIPSAEYRVPSGRVVIRAEGSFSDYLLAESVPLGITLSGTNAIVVRRVVTVSVGVGL